MVPLGMITLKVAAVAARISRTRSSIQTISAALFSAECRVPVTRAVSWMADLRTAAALLEYLNGKHGRFALLHDCPVLRHLLYPFNIVMEKPETQVKNIVAGDDGFMPIASASEV
jgi:hypothetical protein